MPVPQSWLPNPMAGKQVLRIYLQDDYSSQGIHTTLERRARLSRRTWSSNTPPTPIPITSSGRGIRDWQIPKPAQTAPGFQSSGIGESHKHTEGPGPPPPLGGYTRWRGEYHYGKRKPEAGSRQGNEADCPLRTFNPGPIQSKPARAVFRRSAQLCWPGLLVHDGRH